MALVRIDDVFRLIEKLRQGYLRRVVESVFPFANRTGRAWQHTKHPPKHWGSIPRIREHWNEMISGSRDTTMQEYVARSYPLLRDGKCLSIGCGSGSNEVRWAQTNCFASIIAFDISPNRIQAAKKAALNLDSETSLEFAVASFEQILSFGNDFDIIIAENALHHAIGLEKLIEDVFHRLHPGGLLVLRDFVGPSRFQWSKIQLKLTKEMLNRIPASLRKRWKTNTLKTRHFAPGSLGMMMSDPSEAAHSSEIIPLLQKRFKTLEYKPLGGTLLQLVFDDIGHHFASGSAETVKIVEECILEEMKMIEDGLIPSDFVFGVFQRSE